MSRISRLNPKFKPAFDGIKISGDLIAKLVQQMPVTEAYLFGSSAEGKNSADSDVDILVVIPNESKVANYYLAVNVPFFSPVAVDWIFKTEQEFIKDSEIGGVAIIAKNQGKRIWPHGS